ncbi:amidohydrolase family protein [Dactylosporangium sp. NPDC051484]|uniref:amidohydrolase family protein n=1 Tax=Dactylosporangium sp. NPDC051484 TaxID=3154942 RepID=UPI00344B599E
MSPAPRLESNYLDRALDLDSHEMVPIEFWGEIFDQDIASEILAANMKWFTSQGDNSLSCPDLTADDSIITPESVWSMKGPRAPGAIDFSRRLEVLDAMRVDRQLVFPTFGLFGYILLSDPGVYKKYGFDPATIDQASVGSRMIAAHNRWAANVTKSLNGRVRPVAIVQTDTLELMLSELDTALSNGCRAILVPEGTPPAQTSPGAEILDPFWARLAEANVPVTTHIGCEHAFTSSQRWSANVPAFIPSMKSSIELPIEPRRLATMHYAVENFLTAMILGGVFERHPTLRFGAIELTAAWVGPLGERLDELFEKIFRTRLANLSMKPSEYIERNVRVTPFVYEPIDTMLDRYPYLENVLVYSSDYPHVEGGVNSKNTFNATLERFSDRVKEKFFVTNGEWILPE